MSIGDIAGLMQGAIAQVFLLCGPVLGGALVIGLIVAIFQATTSIQESTLTFLPKLVAILLVLFLLGGLGFSELRNYTLQLFSRIPDMAR